MKSQEYRHTNSTCTFHVTSPALPIVRYFLLSLPLSDTVSRTSHIRACASLISAGKRTISAVHTCIVDAKLRTAVDSRRKSHQHPSWRVKRSRRCLGQVDFGPCRRRTTVRSLSAGWGHYRCHRGHPSLGWSLALDDGLHLVLRGSELLELVACTTRLRAEREH